MLSRVGPIFEPCSQNKKDLGILFNLNILSQKGKYVDLSLDFK